MKSTNNKSSEKATVVTNLTEKLIVQSIAKIDCYALGATFGIILGAAIFFFTIFVRLKGDSFIISTLSLLNQYFWGYTVSFKGSFIGLLYGVFLGFALGWTMAFIRNTVTKIYLFLAKYNERLISVNNFIDYP